MDSNAADAFAPPHSPRRVPLILGFGGLLLLIVFFTISTAHQAMKIYGEMSKIHEEFRKNNETMTSIRMNIYLSSILLRDYLLDTSLFGAFSIRQELTRTHSDISLSLDSLERRFGQADAAAISQFRRELNARMEALNPIFSWTVKEKQSKSSSFLRDTVMPRRERILRLAQDISELNQFNFQRQVGSIRRQQEEFSQYLIRLMLVTILAGLLVAGVSMLRILKLERRTSEEYHRAESAEREMRLLSQRLVKAQEEERKAISRDLHDQVGQILTALRLGLGSLEKWRNGPIEKFNEVLMESKQLAEQTLRLVRDMSMGLRPSMLDDLGLEPALEWLSRDFSRRSGLTVTTEFDGILDHLPEIHRTCIYRTVQEALTNCARHSQAEKIRIVLHGSPSWVSVVVQDDGVGMAPENSVRRGIGLIGIEERVRELGGSLYCESQPGKGTLIRAEIPVSPEGKQ